MRVVSSRNKTWLLLVPVVAMFMAFAANGNPSSAEPEPTPQGAKDVAREILKLQEELGGSVVNFPSADVEAPVPKQPKLFPRQAHRQHDEQDPVAILRQSALELDLLAHRLELLDLYEQSDATRQLAQRLRVDARQRKATPSPAKPE